MMARPKKSPPTSAPFVTPEELHTTDPLRMLDFARLPRDVREHYQRVADYVNAKVARLGAPDA